MAPVKVSIIGSGNWGSAIAHVVGTTTAQNPGEFDGRVNMWVFEEMFNGRKLSEIINTDHENAKYLPGKKLPENVFAVPDLLEACADSDVLIFVLPHQFVPGVCKQLHGKLKEGTHAVSLIKDGCLHYGRFEGFTDESDIEQTLDDAGLMAQKMGGIRLVLQEIHDILHIDVSVLMGANLATEVASDNFCEATIGCSGDETTRAMLKKLFQTRNFRITVVKDAHTVELCGALKNIVACAAGFIDGMGNGDNTKAAAIRLGLTEITKFVEQFYPGMNMKTFFESCGVADLIVTCYAGRNRRVCEAFVRSGKTMAEVEKEVLGGQSAQGPLCAEEVHIMLKHFDMEAKFPLFTVIHKICTQEVKPNELMETLRSYPDMS